MSPARRSRLVRLVSAPGRAVWAARTGLLPEPAPDSPEEPRFPEPAPNPPEAL